MIEFILGLWIGGLGVTALWIFDLKHIVNHNRRVSDILLAELYRKYPDLARASK